MKKQILFIAVITSAILLSCSKEKIETASTQSTESVGSMENKTVPTQGLVINTLTIGLAGQFEFDGNLKDATGKLEDAYPTVSRLPVVYTNDRKGQAKKAIYFNAKYGLDVFDIPSTPGGCSFSVWIKYDSVPPSSTLAIVNSWKAFRFQQFSNQFWCTFFNSTSNPTGQAVFSNPTDNKWHHIVATHDNAVMNLYIDGILIGTSPTPAGAGPYFPTDNYNLGYGWGSYWKGSMDDLRFYKRVLTASEVTQLYNL